MTPKKETPLHWAQPIDVSGNDRDETKPTNVRSLSDNEITRTLNTLHEQTGITILVDPNAPTIPVTINGQKTQETHLELYRKLVFYWRGEEAANKVTKVPPEFKGKAVEEATAICELSGLYFDIKEKSVYFDENTNAIVREGIHDILEDLSVKFVGLSQQDKVRRHFNYLTRKKQNQSNR